MSQQKFRRKLFPPVHLGHILIRATCEGVAAVGLRNSCGRLRRGQSLDIGPQPPQTLVTQGAAPCVTVKSTLQDSLMPTNKRRIAVNLADGEYSDLAALAERHDVSMAWLGRQAILEFMENHHSEQQALPMRLPVPRGSRNNEIGLPRGGRS